MAMTPLGRRSSRQESLQFPLKAIYIYGRLLMVETGLFEHPYEFISRQAG
jgi:hypothetical protein